MHLMKNMPVRIICKWNGSWRRKRNTEKNLKRLNVTDELPAVIYDVRTLPSFYQMMVADGRIENLSPYLEEDEEWRNMIEPAVMEGCTDEDGNIYLE